jgi:hypothetical protein
MERAEHAAMRAVYRINKEENIWITLLIFFRQQIKPLLFFDV